MEEQLRDFLTHVLADRPEFFLVEVSIQGETVRVEADSDAGITLDDCALLTVRVNEWLEGEGLDYEVEFGSPGLTRPFRHPRQYAKNVGRRVQVIESGGVRQRGELVSADGEGFRIRVTEMVRAEGEKRPKPHEREIEYAYDGVKRVTLDLDNKKK